MMLQKIFYNLYTHRLVSSKHEWNKCNDEEKNKEEECEGAGKIMKLGAVVSIGTGKLKPNPNSDGKCQCEPSGRGGCYDISKLARTMMLLKGEIAKSDGQVVEQSFTFTKSNDGALFRFTPQFSEEIEMDETDNLTLIDMMWSTKVYMRRQTKYIQALKDILDNDPKESDEDS